MAKRKQKTSYIDEKKVELAKTIASQSEKITKITNFKILFFIFSFLP